MQKNYFVCRFGENNPLSGCYKAKYEAEEIKSAVLEELLRHITWFYPWDKDTRKWKKSSTESVQKGEHYTQKINALRREQLMLYKKFKSGKMKKNEYLIKKEEKNKKIRKNEYLKKQNKEETDGEERVIRRYMDEIKINDKKTEPAWLIHCRIGNELTSELRETFINKVFVYSSERIKIVWRFQDVFT